jgi:hypothetical protein
MKSVLLILTVVYAAAAQQTDDRAKRVVDSAIAALGGNKFLNMRDRVEHGRAYSFYQGQMSGLTQAKFSVRYLVRPEPPVVGFFGLRERQVLGKTEDYYNLFTETECYEVTFRGAKPIAEETVQRFRESTLHNILYILRMRLGEPGMSIDYRGADVWDNQPVDILEFADDDNRQVTVYFHRSTKLPVKQLYVRRDPKTRERFDEVTLFSKYRDVGGVQWPYQIRRERNGFKIFEMFDDSVLIDQGLTDDQFTLPGSVKMIETGKK